MYLGSTVSILCIMAVLGVQLTFSMLMASILSKVSSRCSFARWILCSRLVRYLHPTEEELRKLCGAGGSGGSAKGKPIRSSTLTTVPKNLPLQLESVPIRASDVIPLHFYTEFQWLLDFALGSVLVYLASELYYAIFQAKQEFNLSMLWCLLVVGFALRILFSLTAIYFRTEEGGEKIVCVMFGFFFLVAAMGILIVDDSILEFEIQEAYYNFTVSARQFFTSQGMDSSGPMSLLTFRIALAIICGILGAFMTFPGLRIAKMHTDAQKYCGDRPILQLLLHVNMIMPLLISLMWLRPVMRDFVVRPGYRGKKLMLTNESFDNIRILVILGFCLFRFLLVWTHLQAYLNLACDKIDRLKKEVGRIGVMELQRLVARVFYYLCVVALQYLAPLTLLLFLTLMLKTLGNYSLTTTFGIDLPVVNLALGAPTPSEMEASDHGDGILGTAAQFSLAFADLRNVFTAGCFRALLSFLIWWLCASWFLTSAFGLLYHSYFEAI